MNGKKAKRLRKSALAYGDDMADSVYHTLKKQRGRLWTKNNIPKKSAAVLARRHLGETKDEFKDRRKKCNQRRRTRERIRQHERHEPKDSKKISKPEPVEDSEKGREQLVL